MRPWEPITADDVAELIDLTVEGQDTESMALLQRQGIAGLHRILEGRRAAYLADEVGMGKTYQAMGLAAVRWNDRPNARILFISPRENLQFKWVSDYRRFFADNYRRPQGLGDDMVSSVLFRRAVHRATKFDRLPDWTESLGRREPMAAFLRHTSFARPVYLRPQEYASHAAYWDAVTGFCGRAGLYDLDEPGDLLDAPITDDNMGFAANLAFARAANRRLSARADGDRYFDLVVMDESQCLRNPGNQTNTLLHELFRGQVDRWLFMSATPAHSGAHDIVTVMNHYPGDGQILDPALVSDLPRLQSALEDVMVRRSRRYVTATGAQLNKTEYRGHDIESWAVTDDKVGALPTLAMGLLQKGLVDVLGQRGNRFKIGFLSSFESLQSSVRGQLERDEESGDWHVDSGAGVTDDHPADDNLIDELVNDFRERFGRELPHPKLEAIAQRVGELAFGTDDAPGGEKVLVFTRRVSTVSALRNRLTVLHRQRVEARLSRVWGWPADNFNWADPGVNVAGEDDDPEDDPEGTGIDVDLDDADLIRIAMQPKEWLGRYRRTFQAKGRNALFFEDGWFARLCDAGGVSPAAAATALPASLWAEAWQHATRTSRGKEQRYQAHRLRYLAWHALDRYPEHLGLDATSADLWRAAYETALHEHLAQEQLVGFAEGDDAHVDPSLAEHRGLWGEWDRRLEARGLALPASDVDSCTTDSLHERQVARTVLSQVLRLSDAVIDLWAADERGGGSIEALAVGFVSWLEGEDLCAVRLRRELSSWLTHLRTILDSSLDGSGHAWAELARRETWPQLYQLAPVLGVTGGSGAQQRATQQFRTPSMPKVIVCTDTLKEGVDLHLFCDRVVHYGVAWTAGDQEQRVGRVDRYFSQIERRVRASSNGDAILEVGYPHVVRTIERRQVERVMERQRHAERLMDSPLAGHDVEEKEFIIDGFQERSATETLDPFAPPVVAGPGRQIAALSQAQAERVRDHYVAWHQSLVQAAEAGGGRFAPSQPEPVETQTVTFNDHLHDVEWGFDGALKRYVIDITNSLRDGEAGFSGGRRRRRRSGRWQVEKFLEVILPTEDDPVDATLAHRLIAAAEGAAPARDKAADDAWGPALDGVATSGVAWLAPHKAVVDVACVESRHHKVSLYAYEGEARLLGTAATTEQLAAHLGVKPDDRAAMELWALEHTASLDLGYVDIHDRDGVVFGMHALHGHLTPEFRSLLVREVAWRADALESIITGRDQW